MHERSVAHDPADHLLEPLIGLDGGAELGPESALRRPLDDEYAEFARSADHRATNCRSFAPWRASWIPKRAPKSSGSRQAYRARTCGGQSKA
jgi:hypothetical protein